MEAILLVGGLGTRLHPLTLTQAKPMLPLGNIPITEHQLLRASKAGISRIVLSTSYLSDSFREYFQDGSRWGIQLVYAIEDEPLGTAGAIRNASQYLSSDAPVFVFNGDVISRHDLESQLSLHVQRDADATLHLLPMEDVRSYGKVSLDSTSKITEFLEKPESLTPIKGVINAGCYVINPEVLETIATDRPVSIERETFPQLLSSGKLLIGYSENSYWLDLGTPTRYLKANLDLLENDVSHIGSATIDPTSVVTNSVIGFNVTIGAHVSISNSLVLNNVTVNENSQISHTILGNNVTVLANSHVQGVVAGDNLTLSGDTFPQSATIGEIATSEF